MLQLTTTRKTFDYTDKRKLPVVRRVIAFVSQMSTTTPTQLHNRKLREVFGKESNDFAKHLKAITLVKVSQQYIVGKQSQSYVRNEEGLNRLVEQSGITAAEAIAEALPEQQRQELESGDIEYIEGDNRFYHSLINLKRETKREFWESFGYNYDYDIENCAPTLLYQAAINSKCAPVFLLPIKQYIDDKNALREFLMQLLEVDRKAAKDVLVSLFNHAKLSPIKCRITEILTRRQIDVLRNDKTIKGLRSAIKYMWRFLARKHKFKNTGANRWKFYRAIERTVMDVVVSCCTGRVFREHDGLRTDTPLDVSYVIGEVQTRTTYSVSIAQQESENGK